MTGPEVGQLVQLFLGLALGALALVSVYRIIEDL